jgi:hypothetical protein
MQISWLSFLEAIISFHFIFLHLDSIHIHTHVLQLKIAPSEMGKRKTRDVSEWVRKLFVHWERNTEMDIYANVHWLHCIAICVINCDYDWYSATVNLNWNCSFFTYLIGLCVEKNIVTTQFIMHIYHYGNWWDQFIIQSSST